MSWHPDIPAEYRDAIVTGDARELSKRLPDASADLVFTDPVYDRIEDYVWLGREARRVLKPEGHLLVWQSVRWMPEALQAVGLPYRHTFCLSHSNACVGTITPNAYNHWTPLLWFSPVDRTPARLRPRDFLDVPLVAGSVAGHRWHKSASAANYWLNCFTKPAAVVWDPFTGGGTVPAVCRQLGRHYVAFEIDPETASLARERVRNTPLPLLLPDAPAPLTLDLEEASV
jgi:hypothetical protein